MAVVEGFPIDIDGTIQTLVNKYLRGDLTQPGLFGNLIVQKGGIKKACR